MNTASEIKTVPFSNALITNVELKDGSTTQIVTLFNNSEIGFEEVMIGVRKTLEFTPDAFAMKNEFMRIKNGKALKTGFLMDEKIILNKYPYR